MSDSDIPFGRFELIERVGSGGMASVWSARHVRSGRLVAVKVIAESRAPNPRYRQAFQQEVEAVAGLSHPNVVEVYDYGGVPESAVEATSGALMAGAPYLAMELADSSLAERRPTSWREVRDVLLGILDALACAHAHGLVHRDLKPANVLRVGERLVVADFGLAHAVRRGPGATGEVTLGASSGTPWYMSPEQFLGRWRDFGPWTDLYAVGCIACELATHQRAFDAESVVELAQLHLNAPRPAVRASFPVPERFEEWVHDLLAVEAGARPRFAADAARELVRLGEAPAGASRSAEVDPTAPTAIAEETATLGATTVLTSALLDVAVKRSGSSRGKAVLEELPVSWTAAPTPNRAAMTDVGLSLFGLRTIRIVARTRELERLWANLRSVVAERRVRAVVVEGSAGVGRTRLVRALAERAHELGAAESVFVRLEGGVPLHTAMGRAIEEYTGARGLDADQVRRRLREWLEARRSDLPPVVAAAWMELVQPAIDQPHFFFRGPEERYNAYTHFFATAACSAPALIVVLDDLTTPEALSYLEWLLEQEIDAPILLVATCDPVDDDERAVLERSGARQLSLVPLSESEHIELVRRILPLTPQGAGRVARHTGANPQFARQLVGEWIATDVLEASDAGFVPPEDEEHWPVDLPRLWARRLDRVVGDDTTPLEIASVLGARVNGDEWLSAMRFAEVEPDLELVAELLSEGIARRDRNDWWFVDASVREYLATVAREAGRFRRWHLLCAELLATLHPGRAMARRRAHHLEMGGRLQEAAAELLSAVEYMDEHGLRREIAEPLARREALLDELGVPADARERVRGRQMMLHEEGIGEPDELARWAAEARDRGWFVEAAEWTRAHAASERDQGDLKRAEALFREALELTELAEAQLERGDDADGSRVARVRGFVQGGLAWVLLIQGQLVEAEAWFGEAIDYFVGRESYAAAAGLQAQVGWIQLSRGDADAARTHALGAARVARGQNAPLIEATAINILGEIARHEGDFALAVRRYRESAEIYETFARRHVVSSLLNLGFGHIGLEDWSTAEEILSELIERAHRSGLSNRIGLIELGLATCAAGLGDEERFSELFDRASGRIEASGMVTNDISWLAERAARHAREHGFERYRAAIELAAAQLEALGKLEKASRMRAAL